MEATTIIAAAAAAVTFPVIAVVSVKGRGKGREHGLVAGGKVF